MNEFGGIHFQGERKRNTEIIDKLNTSRHAIHLFDQIHRH